MTSNLRQNLLTYIAFCLKYDGNRFSYIKASEALKKIQVKHRLTTLRKEFSLLKKDGLIEFKTHYRKLVPALTQKGKLEIKIHLPFHSFGAWDSLWRMVTIDLPQNEHRARLDLIKSLEKLGFARLQKNAYLSPYPLLGLVARLASYKGIRQHIELLTVSEIKERKNLSDLWNIKKINNSYITFLESKLEVKNPLWPLLAKRLESHFSSIYEQDPHLPGEFLPHAWQGEAAYRHFKKIANSY